MALPGRRGAGGDDGDVPPNVGHLRQRHAHRGHYPKATGSILAGITPIRIIFQMGKCDRELTSRLHKLLVVSREYLHGREQVPKKLRDRICELARAIELSRRTVLV